MNNKDISQLKQIFFQMDETLQEFWNKVIILTPEQINKIYKDKNFWGENK